jgi:sucrose phosphorylase
MVRNQPQLISYPDSLGGGLAALGDLLRSDLAGVFGGGVHVLPPFPSSGDRGFAPITYEEIEPAFGDWSDIESLAELGPVMLDVMVNHISRRSPAFVEFERVGRRAESADLFITLDKIWPDGTPQPGDLDFVALRKPDNPFSVVPIAAGGTETIWTTFGFSGGPITEQIDLDITSPRTIELIDGWFAGLAAHGVSVVRLDAIGYLTKAPGTRCFMNEPQIWDHLDTLTELAGRHGLDVLPEVHDGRAAHHELARRGHWSYDFALPGLVLDALTRGATDRLVDHLRQAPERQVTMLDCHDGIGVNPDLRGLLAPADAEAVVARCVDRGANLTLIHHGNADPSTTHQINITFADALGTDDALLMARAIQLFSPGLPQIYYLGLLAGRNDLAAVEASGELRAINRSNFTAEEVRQRLEQPVVADQIELIRRRSEHPAFEGAVSNVDQPSPTSLEVTWRNGEHWATLKADVVAESLTIDWS